MLGRKVIATSHVWRAPGHNSIVKQINSISYPSRARLPINSFLFRFVRTGSGWQTKPVIRGKSALARSWRIDLFFSDRTSSSYYFPKTNLIRAVLWELIGFADRLRKCLSSIHERSSLKLYKTWSRYSGSRRVFAFKWK